MFSAVCVAILYLSTMTLFLAAVVWDTQRVSNYRKDCLGFCCCSEDSYFFCKGKLVSQAQREYIGNVPVPIGDNVSLSSMRSADVQAIKQAVAKRSLLEKWCGFRMGPIVLSKMGRTVVLFVYGIALCIAAYGISEV